MLTRLVEAGQLPPLEKRLPKRPLVVKPVDQPGRYGGTWHTSLLGAGDSVWLTRTAGYEGMLRWDPGIQRVIVNLAESCEVRKGGREYLLRLREGVKWSDGHDFTAADVVFYANDVQNNRELYPVPPENAPTAEQVDRYTVKLTHEYPRGLFLKEQASYWGENFINYPKHYMKKFHKDYNPDVDQLVEQAGLKDWMSLFMSKGPSQMRDPECPTLHPWRPKTPLGKGNRVVLERNPFYWKVDSKGRQLPYIDGLSYEVINDAQVMLLKAMNGEFDMQNRTIGKPANKPTLARNRDKGGYGFFETVSTSMNTTVIAFNLTHKNPALRQVFNNKDFRIGLSYAINRKEIINTVFQRQGRPWQTSPRPDSSYAHERLARQYIEHDVARANEHLDRAGYTGRDPDGFRTGPDGARIAVTVSFPTSWTPQWADVGELLKHYWDAVGVQTTPQAQDRTLYDERRSANDFDVQLWEGEFGYDNDMMLRPMWYGMLENRPAPLWTQWHGSGGKEGERPPASVRRIFELYEQLKKTPEEDRQQDYLNQILDINAEEFYVMGIGLPSSGFGVVKQTFHNVPRSMIDSGIAHTPGQTNPEQYFIE